MDGVALEMEVDTGAELSTIPAAVYHEKLNHIKLQPTTVRLHQYDGSTIPIKGKITAIVSTEEQSVTGSFIIADISNEQLPLLGRDWLMELRLDWHKMLHCHAMHKMQGESLQQEFFLSLKRSLVC